MKKAYELIRTYSQSVGLTEVLNLSSHQGRNGNSIDVRVWQGPYACIAATHLNEVNPDSLIRTWEILQSWLDEWLDKQESSNLEALMDGYLVLLLPDPPGTQEIESAVPYIEQNSQTCRKTVIWREDRLSDEPWMSVLRITSLGLPASAGDGAIVSGAHLSRDQEDLLAALDELTPSALAKRALEDK